MLIKYCINTYVGYILYILVHILFKNRGNWKPFRNLDYQKRLPILYYCLLFLGERIRDCCRLPVGSHLWYHSMLWYKQVFNSRVTKSVGFGFCLYLFIRNKFLSFYFLFFLIHRANFGIFCSTPGIAVGRSVPKSRAMYMLLTGIA